MSDFEKQPYVNSLAEILSYTLSDDEANRAATALISRYGNLDAILSCSESELCEIGGFGIKTAILIKLLGYVNARGVIDSVEANEKLGDLELMEYVKALFLGLTVETVYLILFDADGRMISAEYMGEGTVSASDVYPRRLLECAVSKRAKAVVLAHNHPHGNTAPSMDDVASTKRLEALFSTVGVKLLKHYVVADGDIGVVDG